MKTNPQDEGGPLFHLHIDATRLAPALHDQVRQELGFVDSQFTHLPIAVEHYEAPIHLTLKTREKQVLKSTFGALRTLFEDNEGFEGYLEAEIILFDDDLAVRPAPRALSAPFRASTGALPAATFRQTELHVDFVADEPRCALAESLREMGFYTAFMDKPRGRVQIFTLQGSKHDIRAVTPAVRAHIVEVGGVAHCSIKEERIVDWWVSGAGVTLPPVVQSIAWSTEIGTARAAA